MKWILVVIGSSVISYAGYSQEKSVKSPEINEFGLSVDKQQEDNFKIEIPKANAGRHYIPVIGSYQSSMANSRVTNISISVDEQNPGKIWIEGLTEYKIYAVLKFYPGIYKIPGQSIGNKNLPEGTLLYDDSNKQVNILLGSGYNDASPAGPATILRSAVIAGKKTINKEIQMLSFIGNKAEQGTASK
jgi:hypothetical protein